MMAVDEQHLWGGGRAVTAPGASRGRVAEEDARSEWHRGLVLGLRVQLEVSLAFQQDWGLEQ